jgi:16S rRNA processing protein RimM
MAGRAKASDAEEASWLCAGHIAGAHGVRGWVRLTSYTEPADNILNYGQWQLRRGSAAGLDRAGAMAGEPVIAEPVEARLHGKGLVVRLAGVEDRTAAEGLRGLEVWICEAALPALEAGEYYWRDLIGLRVYSQHEGHKGQEGQEGQELLLGRVARLLETGANDVLVVQSCEGSIDGRERLIPYLPDQVVVDVNLQAGAMRVRWHPED